MEREDMNEKLSNNGITVLTPADGKVLTNGEIVAEGEVWLSVNDDPGNWHEIDETAVIDDQDSEII